MYHTPRRRRWVFSGPFANVRLLFEEILKMEIKGTIPFCSVVVGRGRGCPKEQTPKSFCPVFAIPVSNFPHWVQSRISGELLDYNPTTYPSAGGRCCLCTHTGRDRSQLRLRGLALEAEQQPLSLLSVCMVVRPGQGCYGWRSSVRLGFR